MTQSQHNTTTVAKAKPERRINVSAFVSGDVTYRENSDLGLQLRLGGNDMGSGDVESQVLVKLNVDDCSYNVVEVSSRQWSQTEADTIDAAIESLIVARDALRSMSAAA